MAKAELENGYTRIANQILEALASSRIPRREMATFLAMIRLLYGWNKKRDTIGSAQVAQLVGCDSRSARRLLGELEKRQMLVRHVTCEGMRPTWEIQADTGRWCEPFSRRREYAALSPRSFRGPGSEGARVGESPGPVEPEGRVSGSPGSPGPREPDSKDKEKTLSKDKEPRRKRRSPFPPEGLDSKSLERLERLATARGYTERQIAHGCERVGLWALSGGHLKADWPLTVLNGMKQGWALEGYAPPRGGISPVREDAPPLEAPEETEEDRAKGEEFDRRRRERQSSRSRLGVVP